MASLKLFRKYYLAKLINYQYRVGVTIKTCGSQRTGYTSLCGESGEGLNVSKLKDEISEEKLTYCYWQKQWEWKLYIHKIIW